MWDCNTIARPCVLSRAAFDVFIFVYAFKGI